MAVFLLQIERSTAPINITLDWLVGHMDATTFGRPIAQSSMPRSDLDTAPCYEPNNRCRRALEEIGESRRRNSSTPLCQSEFDRFAKHWARLREIRSFAADWDEDGAPPPSEVAINNAEHFVRFLDKSAIEPSVVNPSVVGGVGFTFQFGGRSAYIEFRNTGNSHAAFMGAGAPRVAPVAQHDMGFRDFLNQVEKHLHEQDASIARADAAERTAD